MKVVTRAIRTRYWKPGDDYRKIILDAISAELNEGDVVAISEKALAVARGLIVDESRARPGIVARSLAVFWMRLVWGFVLSRLCHMKPVNIKRLRTYPLREGAKHKQVCLEHVGLLQALRSFSEGGIDTTNLPYSLASLPLESPKRIAEEIQKMIFDRLGKSVTLTIVDSDKTYSCGTIHLSSRRVEIPGVSQPWFPRIFDRSSFQVASKINPHRLGRLGSLARSCIACGRSRQQGSWIRCRKNSLGHGHPIWGRTDRG